MKEPQTNQSSGAPKKAFSSLVGLLALAAVLMTGLVWFALHRYFVAEEFQRAEARMSLYRSTVLAEVERFEHLTQVLSVDPFVIDALAGGSPKNLDARLAEFAAAAGLDAIFLMRPDGLTIAASNAGAPSSFVGQNYGFRPYFQQAMSGGRGTFYGIGATTGLPGYFIADPVRAASGSIAGVVALKINLVPFEQTWRDAGEQVFLADRSGVILLASNSDWRYRTLGPLDAEALAQILQSRQFPGQQLEVLDWWASDGTARIDGDKRLHQVSTALPHGWQLHYLATSERAATQASLGAGGVVVLAVLALLLAQYQRGLRLGAALRRSEQEEEELRQANAALAREIEVRRRAERRLDETREELGRASRLAALGQLAASVTHELGQPIAAMRNHLAAAEITGKGGALSPVIGGLVDRMEGITRQLKFFARTDSETFDDIDLRMCIDAVLELMAPNIEADGVTVIYDPPEQALLVRGTRLRVEQVLTNLMRNALDAMETRENRQLELRAGSDGETVWLEVSDTGEGLGDATLDQISEPFVTTRESGQGMGLGLAISAGILADHGGRMEARNRTGAGAVFRIILPVISASELAAE